MVVHQLKVTAFADGAARGNPGPASLGAVAFDSDVPTLDQFIEKRECIFALSQALGKKTNNEAEYAAVIAALEECIERGIKDVAMYLDSKLIVEQVAGRWKVKKNHLKRLHARVLALAAQLQVSFKHIPREQNAIADLLANEALDALAEQNA